MYRMSFSEAQDYVEGLNRRSRQDWERTRFLGGIVYKVLTGKNLDVSFPWDENPEKEIPNDEEIEELRMKAKLMEKELTGKL